MFIMKFQQLLKELDTYGPITLIKLIISNQVIVENKYLIFFGIFCYILWIVDFWKLFEKPYLHLALNYRSKKSFRFYLYYFHKFILSSLCLVSMLYLSFSLCEPKKIVKIVERDIVANDIYLVVDTSRSMLANDFVPNRMEMTKKRISEFVTLRSVDRVGIILFSEKIFTLVPLTRDFISLQEQVDDIKTGILGDGTNIGDALSLTIARLKNSIAKNKTIILFTDGVGQVESVTPIQAAKMALNQKIRIYTVAIGKDKDAKIPVETEYDKLFIGKNSEKKYRDNIRFQNIPGGSVDIDLLKEISKITGGKFYHVFNENALEKILNEISLLEKVVVDKSNDFLYEYISYFYMFWGIVILLTVEIIRRVKYEVG
ncbi:MAG: VWA domain-containing protein [Oligoflexia bacterium]|nr:VWA domain-containing protein [Oligoflexia bacterium]